MGEKIQKNLKDFLRNHIFILFFSFIILLLFSSVSPDFIYKYSLQKIIWRNTYTVIMAIGLSFVIAGGWIDISVGYQISLISVIAGRLLEQNVSCVLVILSALLAGILCGLFNGLLITWGRLGTFAATLTSQIIFKGLSYAVSSGGVFSNLPEEFRVITNTKVLGIHLDNWIMLFCLILAAVFFRFTYWGIYIKAIGENEKAVRQSGVAVESMKMFCFILCGFFCALSALVMVSQYGRATSYNAAGMEITGIAAIYVSGTVKPGAKSRFYPIRLFGGVLMFKMLEAGMQSMGWNSSVQYVVTGIILAIAFTQSTAFRSGEIKERF